MTKDQLELLADVAETGRQAAHPASEWINEIIEAGLLLAHDVQGGGRYVTITEAGRAAMREPTEAMKDAGYEHGSRGLVWRAMVAAALQEPGA
jgi:hypothetical protein